jgi:hypothetical protein
MGPCVPEPRRNIVAPRPSETTPTVRPKFWANVQARFAQFRHVTGGTKQSPGRITPTVVDGNFWSAQREQPPVSMKDSQHSISDISVDTRHYHLAADGDGPRSVLLTQGGR